MTKLGPLVERWRSMPTAGSRFRSCALPPEPPPRIVARPEQTKSLPQLRTAEFRASCELLGIKHGEVLSYPDSKLDRADFYEVVGELVARIRRLRPHVVLTFGQDGGLTGHLDHAMAGTFATQAFHWAGRPDRYPEQIASGLQIHAAQKLYYATANFKLPDRMPTSPPTVTARIEVGAERFERKNEAFMKHQTQQPLFVRVRKNLGKMPTSRDVSSGGNA